MAKRDKRGSKRDDKLERTIRRNWIICGVSLIAIIALHFFGK